MVDRETATLLEKGEYQNYATTGELARILGVSANNLLRWERRGKIPPHCVRSKDNGWRLWCPEHVGEAIRRRTSRGRR